MLITWSTSQDLSRLLRFWDNATRHSTLVTQRRFIESFQRYTDSVVEQAADRDHSYIRGIKQYFNLRRETIGAKPAFDILGVKMTIPDEVLNHPVIVTLATATIDMLIIENDIFSFNVE